MLPNRVGVRAQVGVWSRGGPAAAILHLRCPSITTHHSSTPLSQPCPCLLLPPPPSSTSPTLQELAATSLHDQLHERHLRPQWGLFLQLAEDIAAALTHCHAQRPPIVHRDLSAKNILLAADGRARLADFGLAKRRRGDCLSADEVRRVLKGGGWL